MTRRRGQGCAAQSASATSSGPTPSSSLVLSSAHHGRRRADPSRDPRGAREAHARAATVAVETTKPQSRLPLRFSLFICVPSVERRGFWVWAKAGRGQLAVFLSIQSKAPPLSFSSSAATFCFLLFFSSSAIFPSRCFSGVVTQSVLNHFLAVARVTVAQPFSALPSRRKRSLFPIFFSSPFQPLLLHRPSSLSLAPLPLQCTSCNPNKGRLRGSSPRAVKDGHAPSHVCCQHFFFSFSFLSFLAAPSLARTPAS